jgi:PHD/YefM family antitoxin component YafN of YafNO toxin-antitoxin module
MTYNFIPYYNYINYYNYLLFILEVSEIMRIVTAMEVRKNFGKIINMVNLKNEKFIIERSGKPLAAIVPLDVIGYKEIDINMGVVIDEKKSPGNTEQDVTEESNEIRDQEKYEDID